MVIQLWARRFVQKDTMRDGIKSFAKSKMITTTVISIINIACSGEQVSALLCYALPFSLLSVLPVWTTSVFRQQRVF